MAKYKLVEHDEGDACQLALAEVVSVMGEVVLKYCPWDTADKREQRVCGNWCPFFKTFNDRVQIDCRDVTLSYYLETEKDVK